jgi:protein-disulfide isomerase
MRLQLQQSKYNSTLFNNLLHSKPKYSQPKDEWSIVIGNSKPTHIITMVSNPYCQPCAEAHKRLEKLLEQRKDLQARIVFTAENSEHDIKTPVSRHLMSLNNLNDKSIVKGALSDWYERGQKDYHDWSKSYPLEQNPANNYQLDQQREWCKIAQITSTPTLLINGRLLPNLYQLSDLKYILELAD